MFPFRMVAALAMLPGFACSGSALPLTVVSPTAVLVATPEGLAVEPGAPHGSATWRSVPAPARAAVARPTPSAAPAARPTPVSRVPALRPRATQPAFKFPIPVSIGNATQVITVRARGSFATLAAWQRSPTGWHLLLATTSARVGSNGVVAASLRRQGTNTTPGGTFTLTEAFGIAADPGAHLSYHRVTADDWWVEDNNSTYYNQMRPASAGGFDTSLPESDVNGSEQLIKHGTSYQYAVVINYNRWPAVRYKGAGIFLHVNGAGATAGCVSAPAHTLVALLRWLDPAQHPRIAVA